ncbi:MAG: hypothetical protein JSR81_16075 [Proteobacteria bacterium]|nr:hypothetical protein [Pseudomonadota bacterium]
MFALADRMSDSGAAGYLAAQGKDFGLTPTAIRYWSLRVQHISGVLKLGFELALAFIVIAVAVGLAATIWQAAHAARR